MVQIDAIAWRQSRAKGEHLKHWRLLSIAEHLWKEEMANKKRDSKWGIFFPPRIEEKLLKGSKQKGEI